MLLLKKSNVQTSQMCCYFFFELESQLYLTILDFKVCQIELKHPVHKTNKESENKEVILVGISSGGVANSHMQSRQNGNQAIMNPEAATKVSRVNFLSTSAIASSKFGSTCLISPSIFFCSSCRILNSKSIKIKY